MEHYQVLVFNHLGAVFLQKDIEAVDEHAAIAFANRAVDCSNGMGFEVRDKKRRLIHRTIFH